MASSAAVQADVEVAVGSWLVADFRKRSDGAHTRAHKDRAELGTQPTAFLDTMSEPEILTQPVSRTSPRRLGGCVSTPWSVDRGCLVCLHLSTILLISRCLAPGQDGRCLSNDIHSLSLRLSFCELCPERAGDSMESECGDAMAAP
ncbi:unnamed protein product [Symbiodinium sp. CCMP2456]|nr:unnamed protein product [Symbiodinium sp. CCMP2456]